METQLPPWKRVLVVVAHPDDESFGLGGVISRLVDDGAEVSVLCLTAGEASTLGAAPHLARTRALELEAAAEMLGCRSTALLDHPDGGLAGREAELIADIDLALGTTNPDGLLVFGVEGGVTGHPDHEAASRAALAVAAGRGLPVLEWGLPASVASTLRDEFGGGFTGHDDAALPIVVTVDRSRQVAAAHLHVTQAVPGSVLWRRLELLGDREHLRLTPPA
ncbi:PIG-L family deacetylase [Tessaracoccus sp. MC1627]|uniref:PIG-L deacetylase family protein n=1 Tax=Tessaracoccus sp. MC1627 TaxID=2760312 RepID=UPI001600D838|nr:PIG-L deacetylase family protein [Tessaracoccus sp. MC1627]MBB1511424.1 PIG-L family deacetylase [Tessaracoccus sp. MC1627]